MKLSLQKYKLIIFDWDGTLVDSLQSYALWDQLYVKKFYGVDLPVEYFESLAKALKTVSPGSTESKYFRFLDKEYGDGETPMDKIWERVYSLAFDIQSKVLYQKDAPRALKLLKSKTDIPIALATNAEMRDIQFFSSQGSETARHLSPLNFFDTVITSDFIKYPKPHPETFQKVIEQYAVQPSEVLIFEDSLNGLIAAEATGADVVAIFSNNMAKEHAHFVMNDWSELLSILEESVA